MLAQAVPVPELSKLPSLGERKGSASWPLPLLAPAINVLFRPEQKHGPSGEGDILVPFAGWYGDVDDPLSGDEFAFTDLDGHGEIAAPAGRVDAGIFAEHRGDAECVPDAVTKLGAVADCHGKRSGDGGEGCDAPEFAALLLHEGVTLAQSGEAGKNCLCGGFERLRHSRDGGAPTGANHVAIDKKAEAGVEKVGTRHEIGTSVSGVRCSALGFWGSGLSELCFEDP